VTLGRLIVVLAVANAVGGAIAFATERTALGRWLFAMGLLLALAGAARRWIVSRSPIEQQMVAWSAVAVAVFVLAVLATVGVVDATPVETAMFYVAAACFAIVVYGANKLRTGA